MDGLWQDWRVGVHLYPRLTKKLKSPTQPSMDLEYRHMTDIPKRETSL
jgi:hypothetical protein